MPVDEQFTIIWVRDEGQSYADGERVTRMAWQGQYGPQHDLRCDPAGDYEVHSYRFDPSMMGGRWLRVQLRKVEVVALVEAPLAEPTRLRSPAA